MLSRNIARSIKDYKINIVIKVLIISDFFIWGASQFATPIFAIFVTDKINGNIESVGFAVAIYLISKSIFEIPVGVYIDKSKSEKDDLIAAVSGILIMSLAYFSFIFIDSIVQLYFLQAILGLGAAISFPGWYSIFTHHIDKGKEAFEWSLYDVFLGIGMASAAALGGFIASEYGFDVLYTCVGSLSLIGALLLIMISKKIYYK